MIFAAFYYVASAFVIGPECLLVYAVGMFVMDFTHWLRTAYWPPADTVGHYFHIGVDWRWAIPARTVDWFLEFSPMTFFLAAGLVGLFLQVWLFRIIGALLDERSARQASAQPR